MQRVGGGVQIGEGRIVEAVHILRAEGVQKIAARHVAQQPVKERAGAVVRLFARVKSDPAQLVEAARAVDMHVRAVGQPAVVVDIAEAQQRRHSLAQRGLIGRLARAQRTHGLPCGAQKLHPLRRREAAEDDLLVTREQVPAVRMVAFERRPSLTDAGHKDNRIGFDWLHVPFPRF